MTNAERATRYPTPRWRKRFEGAFLAHGGHGGPATLAALAPRAIELYRLGGSAAVVGAACAREYRLYSDLQQSRELEGYGAMERAAAEMHLLTPEGFTACGAAKFGTGGIATKDMARVECAACRKAAAEELS